MVVFFLSWKYIQKQLNNLLSSRSCGSGIRIRHASCQDASGREVNARLCPSNKLDSEKCNEQLCTEWRFGTWSQCSVSCGQGIQRRDANCVDSNNRPLEERNCDIREKIVVKQCELAPCPHWQLGSWRWKMFFLVFKKFLFSQSMFYQLWL